jgi:hypothetical protein
MSGIIDILNGANGHPGLFDTLEGSANSLQRLIDNQVAGQKAAAAASAARPPGFGVLLPQASQNPLEALQQQLFSQINSIPSYQTPLDQLRKQAEQQMGAQYDPMIQMLQQNISQTTHRGKQNEAEAKNMYGSLAKDLASQIPNITNQMHQAQDEATNRYSQAQQQTQQDYSQQSAQQQQILNGLGLQSAQQAAGAQSASDQNYFQNQEQLSKQQAVDAVQQQGTADQSYQRNISDSANMAGTNAVSDLQRQLEDYLGQANTQLGGLESQKSSGIQALLSQLQNADAQNATSKRQSQIDNLMKMFNFQLDTQKELDNQQNHAQTSNPFKGTSGPSGAANSLAQSLGSDRVNTEQQILQLINDTMADPNVVAGRHPQLDANGKPMNDPITGKPSTLGNTDQYIEDLLRNKMESSVGGYQTNDINAAINALLAYMGKLR